MKRILCLCLTLVMVLSCVPVTQKAEAAPAFQAENSSNNTVDGIFYGVISVLCGDSKVPQPYRAARDEQGNVYLHLGDFANILGGTISRLPQSSIYQIYFGNWELDVYCEQLGAYLYYRPQGSMASYSFLENGADFTKALYNRQNEGWYFPMDELLYLGLCNWMCEENYVTVTQPQTLLDLIPYIKQVAPYNPTYNDLMGETVGEQAVNAINYGFFSAVDEIDATFILDSFLVFVGAKDSMTYEKEILKACLLSMADDSPYEGENSGVYAGGMESFSDFNDQFSNAALILDLCPASAQVNITKKLTNLFGTPLIESEITEIAKESQYWATDFAIAEQVADFVFSVADAFWTQQYLQENFKERLLLIQEWTKDEKEIKFGKQLHTAAKAAYEEYYGNFLQVLWQNSSINHAIGVVNAVVEVNAINTPMLALTLFDLYIEALKASPEMKDEFEKAETAHNALEYINTSAYMGNATTKALQKLHDPASISIDYLNDLRLGCQISQNAAMHAQLKLQEMGKGLNKSAEPGAAFLMAVNNSAKFDKVLQITGEFYDLYCNESGCVREQIPPEYVYAGDGIFLSPVNQLTAAPESYTPIETAEDLKAIKNDLAGNYILMADLELEGWEPLGNWEHPFSGTLDGNGHSITINLQKSVTLTEEVYGGIFSHVENGTVKNLHMKGDWNYSYQEPDGDDPFVYDVCIAGIAAHANGSSTFFNCVNSINISSGVQPWRYGLSNYIAGIVADASENYDGNHVTISYCRNMGKLMNTSNLAGIVCLAGNADIYACQNDGVIYSDYMAGGIAMHSTGYIRSCANRGDVTGYIGDSGGIAYSATYIENCVNTGTVFTEGAPVGFAGGIVGRLSSGTVKKCINIGTPGRIPGGIVGYFTDGSIERCYWIETCEKLYGNSNPSEEIYVNDIDHQQGKLTQRDMMYEDSFPGLNFHSTWTLYDGMCCPYPSALLLNGQQPPMAEE